MKVIHTKEKRFLPFNGVSVILLDFFFYCLSSPGNNKVYLIWIDKEKLKRDFNVFSDMPHAVLYCFWIKWVSRSLSNYYYFYLNRNLPTFNSRLYDLLWLLTSFFYVVQLFKKPHPPKRVRSKANGDIVSVPPNSNSDKIFFHHLDNLRPSLAPVKGTDVCTTIRKWTNTSLARVWQNYQVHVYCPKPN